MDTIVKNSKANYIAGGFAILLTLIRLIGLIQYFINVYSLIMFVSYICIAVGLFIKNQYVLAAGYVISVIRWIISIKTTTILGVLSVLPDILAATLVVLVILKKDKIAKSLWFVPGVIEIVYIGCYFVRVINGDISGLITYYLEMVVSCVVMFIASYWVTHKTYEVINATNPNSSAPIAEGEIDLVKHVLLLLFTCGIWYLIWNYRTTSFLNRVEGMPQRNATTELLLCMFVPFYVIYWIYSSCKRIDAWSHKCGINNDITTLCIVLLFFLGIGAPIVMQMQMQINSIVKQSNA